METLLWVLAFPALLLGAWFTITGMGRRALSRHLSEQSKPVDPKVLLAEARKLKEAEKAQWQKEYQEILRKDCTHRFDGNSWKEWWKCLDCGYEKEWHYHGGCACRGVREKSLTDANYGFVLVERSGFCTIHGRDPATGPRRRFEEMQSDPLPHRYEAQ